MKYLFAPLGKRVLESLSFTDTLYAFDFDGTLSPIVDRPDRAALSSETGSFLRTLSRHAPVAVVSGRSVSDLQKRIAFSPGCSSGHLVGNHGLEGIPSRVESAGEAKGISQSWRKQLQENWGRLATDPGVFVEDKEFSLALHYRRSRSKTHARKELFCRVRLLDPEPRVILGKCVINLIPPGGPHKGVAIMELLKQLNLKCALYIGDDDTDEDVFSLPDPRIISVRVGQKKSSQAQFFIKRQSEINRLMRAILSEARKGAK